MKNRDRIIELLTDVRYTTNDIEKVADEMCLLFSVSGSSSFKEKLLKDFIPRIEVMKEKERLHLHRLIENGAPLDFIQLSQKYYNHFSQRIKDYKEYAERL